MTLSSCILIGNESLTVQCGEMLLARGSQIRALLTRKPEVAEWAKARGITVVRDFAGLRDQISSQAVDWLFSVANLWIIPEDVLAMARRGAVNFHDGPLPKYAGLNTPVWALLNREKQHGISWHLITGGVDEGDIIEQRLFDISVADTALTVNTKCFAAAIDSFPTVLDKLKSGQAFTRQDLSQRQYFGRFDRPNAVGRLDFRRPAAELIALVKALNHGDYWNPLTTAKVEIGGQIWCVQDAERVVQSVTDSHPGQVMQVSGHKITVTTGFDAVELRGLTDQNGMALPLTDFVQTGDVLPVVSEPVADTLAEQTKSLIPHETYWRKQLQRMVPAELPMAKAAVSRAEFATLPLNLVGDSCNDILAVVAVWASRLNGNATVDLAFRDATQLQYDPVYHADWVPVRFDADPESLSLCKARFCENLAQACSRHSFARDLVVRDPEIDGLPKPAIGLSTGDTGPIEHCCITVTLGAQGARLHYDKTRLTEPAAARLVAQLEFVAQNTAAQDAPLSQLPILPEAERALALSEWNDTAQTVQPRCIHHLIEAQVAKTPEATALVFEGDSLSYAELNTRANRAAAVLRTMGVGPGVLVGLFIRRSLDMMVGALAIQKAGGAYVPMDPAYPAERIAHFITDSSAPVIVTTAAQSGELPTHTAELLVLDADPRLAQAATRNIDSGVSPDDLAYLIYTSGSTGLPKGVMVEHGNVANFFAGMDAKINHSPPGVWLAVTSLSFDISVLELFYTLARGFKVVLNSDQSRVMPSGAGVAISDQKMDFSLFNWGNDNWEGSNKYDLLLKGAKFADENGFCAVWTPERHFHAFGGLYPNPSVTGAAIAATTKNLAVRAGSIVAPLHHPIRIAEEWAVIDNMTNGRVGLAIASGWHPNDFVLRPENTPPQNKPAMFEAIKTIRKLWAGEDMEFPDKAGNMVPVTTHPRPLSKQIPMWVTTAGNPETWREAGRAGANVLTHLLGQTIAEVAEKTALYHAALRESGYDPADFTVTLMLHTYVADSREQARDTAREPMKSYLRSAAGLIKQYAWAFPAFKRPEGVSNPFELDLDSLSSEELESILDFAFERYFEDSGLFGTIEDCLVRVEQLKQIGISEVACLVDYGLPVDVVLAGLEPLAEVLRRANIATVPAEDDFSIAAQIQRHDVTHLQCTPSMARMVLADPETHAALAGLQQIFIGGEPLPGELVARLGKLTKAPVTNMYGPTETTIWSTTQSANAGEAIVNIGLPIANTQTYVVDEMLKLQPMGMAGELLIGGAGVTRGYWQRPELTAERYVENPFGVGRLYRTGDLVRRGDDGRLEFLGRVDNQVKLRGHRIELGEVETCLETHPHVQQAVVVVREISEADSRLVAYLVMPEPVDSAALRTHLVRHLPEYMLPSHFVALPSIPLTPNKKVDRKALPAPQLAKLAETKTGPAAPQSDLQQQIGAIWSRILGVEKINAGDNFFDLGGHSLLAVQVHREIKADLKIAKLSITDIFRFPVLSALAERLQENSPAAPVATAKPDVAHQAMQRNAVLSKRRAMRARRGGAA